jgi:ABC-type nitrate/sulfonate/bicarbonate transport system ATPase subunit
MSAQRRSATAAEPRARPTDLSIKVDRVRHEYTSPDGRHILAVDDVSIDIPRGQFVAIVGPSGCGKTTVLNMLAGLVVPSEGQVYLNGRVVDGPSRTVGYMFARDGLLPWRTAQANVAFGLEVRGVPRSRRLGTANALLERVGLKGFERAFRSHLSHGMRQRVALARTMAIDPDVFLLDEPFGALDAQTKVLLQEEFVRLWETTGKTVLLVTHDISEAVAMADRVIVFSARPGVITSDIAIDFPRPRDIEGIRYDEAFVRIARRIWRDLGLHGGEGTK